MANKSLPLKPSKVIEVISIVVIIALPVMTIATLALAIYVLIQGYSKLLNGLSITAIASTIAAVGSVAVIVIFDRPVQRIRATAALTEPASIDEMSGIQFEEYVANLLRKAGWEGVTITPATGDHGVDIIAVHNGQKYAIQCKRYRSAVNTKAVQEVYTGKGVYEADYAVVITNSAFTQKAKEMAEKLDIKLWDRNTLEHLLESNLEI